MTINQLDWSEGSREETVIMLSLFWVNQNLKRQEKGLELHMKPVHTPNNCH